MTAPLAWSDLTPTQEQQLLLCAAPRRTYTAHLVDVNLNVLDDLTDRLDRSGSVQWNADAVIHRTCAITLTLEDELAWGTQLVKLGMTLTDTVTGLAAHSDLGVFRLAQPDAASGAWTQPETRADRVAGVTGRPYALTGQDVSVDLDRQIGYSLTAPAKDGNGNPVTVLSNATQVLTSAGFAAPAIRVDGTKAATVMQNVLPWPLTPTSTDGTADTQSAPQQPVDAPTRASGPTTWRTALNDLMGLVNYGSVWAGRDGLIQLAPYNDPGTDTPTFDWSTATAIITVDGNTRALVSPVAPTRTRSLDVTGFNQWTFRWVNMADANGNVVIPTTDNGGLRSADNQAVGPASIQARGGTPRGVSPALVDVTAASLADFAAQCDAIVTAAKRIVTTYKVATVPLPRADHYDLFTFTDDDSTGGEAVTVQARSWTIPLDGGDMSWTWQQVT